MSWQRQVLFIGGFDPKSSAHYHRMYRDAASQRPTSAAGETVHVSKQRQRDGIYAHWEVHWQQPGQDPMHTRYTVLGWHDIVLAHWPRHLGRVLHDYWFVYGHAGMDGTFARVHRAGASAFWLALFPLMLCIGVLGLGTALGAWWGHIDNDAAMLGAGVGFGLSVGLWRWLAHWLDSEWLLRLYGFTFAQAREQLPELDQRIDAFADHLIAAAQAPDLQELLLVGHSTGTILAAQVMARALEKAPWLGTRGPALSLLTLGHCVPILALQPPAQRLREQLAALVDVPQLTWIDYSAPADWAVFAHTPPWLHGQGRTRRLALSPRFHRVLSPVHYRSLMPWHKRHGLHMQYIKAPDLPDGYDPVTLTASPLTLAEQHASLLHAA
jgi:hypothetical protein